MRTRLDAPNVHAATSTFSRHESRVIAQVSTLIGGIPQDGNALGSPVAPVTLQWFSDLECPICRSFALGALGPLINKWVRPGELRIEYRALETATREPEVFKTQQIAALAAGKQHKMWYFTQIFYHEQGEEDSGYVTERFLRRIARQVHGLHLSRWLADRTASVYETDLERDARRALHEGFAGTPSFLIGRTGQRLRTLEYESLTDPGSFNKVIERLLNA